MVNSILDLHHEDLLRYPPQRITLQEFCAIYNEVHGIKTATPMDTTDNKPHDTGDTMETTHSLTNTATNSNTNQGKNAGEASDSLVLQGLIAQRASTSTGPNDNTTPNTGSTRGATPSKTTAPTNNNSSQPHANQGNDATTQNNPTL